MPWAADDGHQEVIEIAVAEFLLKKGAQVDTTEKNGCTPLHLAAQQGHTAVAESLLKKGAKVDAVNKSGQTPLPTRAV